MASRRIEARNLPESPLDAAAAFAVRIVPQVREAVGEDRVVLFDAADHTHEKWRLAMVEELAREAAPSRLNAIVGSPGEAVDQAVRWLEEAPGVTGQVLVVANAKP